ncbi:insulin-like growth factor-binding protein 7 [Amia ocellicauda]|uniref:insulin-like growth factor-binding protein 7 n=1 Tax=Amia ocellicauda TaxID=2972642 RepID=UPI00346465EF
MLAFLALVVSLSYVAGDRGCPPCQPSLCAPLPAEGCQQGTVTDLCGCCSVCAAGQGEPCGGRGGSPKRCGAGMECVKSGKGKRGTCVCKSGYEVCGSDGVTYGNVCEMRAASRRAVDGEQSEIKVLKKGKCERAPVIVTPPKEIWNVTGAQVFLSCEAIGVPTPVLVWKKILTTSKGVENLELLPGDRDNLAIQTRGGPEKHEVTGWVLISPLSKLDAGDYECHATNSKGQVSAVGSIHVVDSTEDIPSKKAQEDEL